MKRIRFAKNSCFAVVCLVIANLCFNINVLNAQVSNYNFTFDGKNTMEETELYTKDSIEVNKDKLEIIKTSLTVSSDAPTLTNVIFQISVEGDNSVQLWFKNPLDNKWYDIVAYGYLGEVTGFPLAADDFVELDFYVAAEAGEYLITTNLIDLADNNKILETLEYRLTVNKPVVMIPENEILTTDILEGISNDKPLELEAKESEKIIDITSWFDEGANYKITSITSSDESIVDLGSVAGLTFAPGVSSKLVLVANGEAIVTIKFVDELDRQGTIVVPVKVSGLPKNELNESGKDQLPDTGVVSASGTLYLGTSLILGAITILGIKKDKKEIA